MVEVTLREYCEEIDSLIDQGAFDAAISHCRHILKIHPKYLRVYSLLGKAALEDGDLEAAADLFGRVLSMDPEDFVARVGMSIASDKDGSLDQAIWHMERAFELAPDNQAIVGELSRLYGRRDGVEPKKVPLTQGALARLHARGNLYTQAINEQRRLLQTEPERVDLQVALATTLWRADRRIEAAEASLAILEKLPYCLKANLILGEIWSSSGREIEGAAHLERAQMIDPENEIAQTLFGERSPLPRTEVRVGRMEYVSPPAPTDQESDWLETLVEEGDSTTTADEAVPDWLQAVAASAMVEAAKPEEDAAPQGEQVPDWLQDVAATADLDVEEFVSAPETPALTEEEMPDWLAQLTTEPQAAADDFPEPEGIGEPPAAVEEGLPGPDDVPDWLAEIGPAVAGLTAAELAAAMEEKSELTEAELLDAQEPELAPGEIPDWLAQMAPIDLDTSTEEDLPETDLIGAEPELTDIPEWLAEMPSADESTAADVSLDEAEFSEDIELAPGEIPDWLAEMAPSATEAPTDVLPTEADVEHDEAPDWLAEMALVEEDVLAGPEIGAEEPTEAAGIQEEPVAEELDTALPPPVSVETPSWLEELVIAAGATIADEAPPTDETAEPEEEVLPEWLAEMETTPDTLVLGEATQAIGVEDLGTTQEELVAHVQEREEETIEAEAELLARMEEMTPEEAFAAWEALLIEGEEEPSDEALRELDTLQVEAPLPSTPVVIEEPDGEMMVYPEGAGEEVADAEAELMARMEEMSPEEAFAAWEAMLAESEALEPEDATPIVEEVALPSAKTEEEIPGAETELMARLEEMSPEEAFAAWEAMLAESDDQLLEDEAPAAEVVAGEEEAWMALAEDEFEERAAAPIAVEETLATEVQADLIMEDVEQELPSTPTAEPDEAWMTLAEDEGLEHAPTLLISAEESIAAEIEATERAEEEEAEIEIPAWATTEAVEAGAEVPLSMEQEIEIGPDLVLLTEEEEAEIKLPPEPELAATIDVAEPVPDKEQPTEEEAEAIEQPTWLALEEEPVSQALAEAAPGAEEEVAKPDSDQTRLELARELWSAGQKADARAEYERLLRSTMRAKVTTDLEKLASAESADEPTLRLLGDAYMKEDRLQEALEAYRRALSSL